MKCELGPRRRRYPGLDPHAERSLAVWEIGDCGCQRGGREGGGEREKSWGAIKGENGGRGKGRGSLRGDEGEGILGR